MLNRGRLTFSLASRTIFGLETLTLQFPTRWRCKRSHRLVHSHFYYLHTTFMTIVVVSLKLMGMDRTLVGILYISYTGLPQKNSIDKLLWRELLKVLFNCVIRFSAHLKGTILCAVSIT